MGDLLTRLGAQARQFFGEEPYTIEGTIDVDVEEEISNVSGKKLALQWHGTAYYVTVEQ